MRPRPKPGRVREVPDHVRAALGGQRPEFVVRARRLLPRFRAVALTVVGLLSLGFALYVGSDLLVAAFQGKLEMSVNDGPPRPVPAGDPFAVTLIALGTLFLGSLSATLLFLGLRGLLAAGPWVVGTREGLHVVRPRSARFHPWSDFVGVRRAEHPDGLVLTARPGVRMQTVTFGRALEDLDLPLLDDAALVLSECQRRIAPPAEPGKLPG